MMANGFRKTGLHPIDVNPIMNNVLLVKQKNDSTDQTLTLSTAIEQEEAAKFLVYMDESWMFSCCKSSERKNLVTGTALRKIQNYITSGRNSLVHQVI